METDNSAGLRKKQFEDEFRPMLMKKIYPKDTSGIRYLLTTYNSEEYILNCFADICDGYRPFLIISPEVSDVLCKSHRELWRIKREDSRHLSTDEIEGYTVQDADSIPEISLETKEQIKNMFFCMEKIGPSARKRISGHYLNGKSYRDIADEEHRDAATVSRSVRSGLRKLKTLMSAAI